MQTETKVMIGVGIASLIILIGGGYFYSKNVTPPTTDLDPTSVTLLGNMENVIKAPNEKIKLVEFGDFECPACKLAYPNVNQLLSDPKYKDTVTFIWRTYPIHMQSILASRAAFIVKELSNDPNKFFQMKDLMFEKQDEWSTESGAKNQVDLFAGYAQSLGVDVAKFKDLLATNKYEDVIQKDKQDAMAIGTQVTPSFYVNGKLVAGADINKLKSKIDEELSK